MPRRRILQAALAANAVLLVLTGNSIRLGLFSDGAAQRQAAKPQLAVAAKSGLAVAQPPPLQAPVPVSVPVAPLAPAPRPLQAVAPPPAPSLTEKLKADIWNALAGSSAQTAGIAVELEGLGRVLDANSDAMLTPASAQKLRTAGVALLKLGPSYQFRTEVLGTGEMTPEGVWEGDLVLSGGGDPSLGRAELGTIAASLHASGLRVVEGRLWGDESRYDNVRYGPGWKPDYVTHESGTLSALAVDQNDYRNDPAFINDPASANADLFREALKMAGVAVNGPAGAGRPPGDHRVLAGHYSPPLSSLVATMLKDSDNFYAEMLMKELGKTIGKPTTGGGAEVVQATVGSFGVSPGEVHDGSGLSPLNRQSAAGEVSWLRAMDGLSFGPQVRASLAVSCAVPGTLKKRFCGTSAAGQVIGKTGALPGSAVLVGYTRTKSGRQARFSFILSGNHSNRQARAAIDRAVVVIRDFQG